MRFANFAKRLIPVVLSLMILLVSMPVVAQLPVIIAPTEVTWDHDDPSIVEEWRMYCQNTPGIDRTDPANLKASIAGGVQEWTLSLPPGIWYCAVTAAIPSQSLESGPSNELGFTMARFEPRDLRFKIVPPSSD